MRQRASIGLAFLALIGSLGLGACSSEDEDDSGAAGSSATGGEGGGTGGEGGGTGGSTGTATGGAAGSAGASGAGGVAGAAGATAVNQPPVITTPDGPATLTVNTVRTITLSVSDDDVTALQKVEMTLVVDIGATIALPVWTGLTFSIGTAIGGETTVKFQGTLANINATLSFAGVELTPLPAFLGDVTLTATVSDLGNTGSDGAKLVTETWVTTYGS